MEKLQLGIYQLHTALTFSSTFSLVHYNITTEKAITQVSQQKQTKHPAQLANKKEWRKAYSQLWVYLISRYMEEF